MLIQHMHCYFLYNIPVSDRLTLDGDGDDFGLCVDAAMIAKLSQHFDVQPTPVPAFYTLHYRTQHTPYRVQDPTIPDHSYIPKEKLAAIPFFADLDLKQDVAISWGLTFSLNGIGMVTLRLHLDEALSSTLAYRLGGLYLNPEYAVIATEPLARLWELPDTVKAENGHTGRPEFVTPDELARAIQTYFLSHCGMHVYRYWALRHEIQVPFIAVELQTECASQPEFLAKEAQELVELVFRPACWEVGRSSSIHMRNVLAETRVWSVSRDTLVLAGYEGTLYVKITNFSTDTPHEVSEFRLASEASVLHTFKVAASNYHFLRVLDELLDEALSRLIDEVHHCQHTLSKIPDDESALEEMDNLSIHITYLRFQLLDLLEEISNSDKLIDEEYHIILLDKLNAVLGTKAWFNGLNRRIDNLRELVQTIENTYERLADLKNTHQIEQFNAQMLQISLENQKLDTRLSKAQPFFEALAAVEALNLLLNIWFDPSFPLVNTLGARANWELGLGLRLVATALVIGALFLVIWLIHKVAGYMAARRQEQRT